MCVTASTRLFVCVFLQVLAVSVRLSLSWKKDTEKTGIVYLLERR